MDKMDEIHLGLKINEILTLGLKKEGAVNVLINCIIKLIILPRFELLATLETLNGYMLEKNRNDDFKKKINAAKKESEIWILSSDNKNFSKIWNDENKTVPIKIHDIYTSYFGMNVNELIDKYIKNFDEFVEEIELSQRKQYGEWLSQKKKETKKDIADLETIHEKELEKESKEKLIEEMNKKMKGGKSMKERKKEEEEAAKFRPEDKKITRTKKYVDIQYIDGIQEIKKQDKQRFEKIFSTYEKLENTSIPDASKEEIMKIWYGDYYAKGDYQSDDILNIVLKHSLKLKIQNEHINPEVNRLILQTYIVGLYLGLNIYKIYTIINDIYEANPTISNYKINPSMIHNGNVPNLKIQEVLNPIIKNIPFDKDQNIIRENWDKIRFPNIDVSDVIEYIKNLNMNKELETSVICSIQDLQEEILSTNLTIEKFAKKIYEMFKKQPMKIKMTEKEIIELLTYDV
jgi:hypothetical protein